MRTPFDERKMRENPASESSKIYPPLTINTNTLKKMGRLWASGKYTKKQIAVYYGISVTELRAIVKRERFQGKPRAGRFTPEANRTDALEMQQLYEKGELNIDQLSRRFVRTTQSVRYLRTKYNWGQFGSKSNKKDLTREAIAAEAAKLMRKTKVVIEDDIIEPAVEVLDPEKPKHQEANETEEAEEAEHSEDSPAPPFQVDDEIMPSISKAVAKAVEINQNHLRKAAVLDKLLDGVIQDACDASEEQIDFVKTKASIIKDFQQIATGIQTAERLAAGLPAKNPEMQSGAGGLRPLDALYTAHKIKEAEAERRRREIKVVPPKKPDIPKKSKKPDES